MALFIKNKLKCSSPKLHFEAAENADFADLTLINNLLLKKIRVKSAKSGFSTANNSKMLHCQI
jgi:hypothetical protein